jgi:hypothetical protein
MTITLYGLILGQLQKAPKINVKSFQTEPDKIILEAKDMGKFTEAGIIELIPLNSYEQRLINVCIDSENWGWYGTAQFRLFRNRQVIISDNFQSGVSGPIGMPTKCRQYEIK